MTLRLDPSLFEIVRERRAGAGLSGTGRAVEPDRSRGRVCTESGRRCVIERGLEKMYGMCGGCAIKKRTKRLQWAVNLNCPAPAMVCAFLTWSRTVFAKTVLLVLAQKRTVQDPHFWSLTNQLPPSRLGFLSWPTYNSAFLCRAEFDVHASRQSKSGEQRIHRIVNEGLEGGRYTHTRTLHS